MSYYGMERYRWLRRLSGGVALLCLIAVLAGSRAPTALERVIDDGKLTIVSRNGATTYYEGPTGLTGFEYALASAFAKELGVELDIVDGDNPGRILELIKSGKADLAAAGLTITPERQQQVRFNLPYMDVTPQVLYHVKGKKPHSIEDLLDKDILVLHNSSHAERLRELQKDHPRLRWFELSGLEVMDLVEAVHDGRADYAIVNSDTYALNRSLYPRAMVAFDLGNAQQLGWAFSDSNDSSLFDAATRFFKRARNDRTLADITENFYGHADEISNGGALLFASRIQSRLPRYQDALQDAAITQNLDWHLLAAVSYQESHWNARARSHTGVRGLMMLTQDTARDMGVTNRTDPFQSITGGAKYLRTIFDRIPDEVQGLDRTWLTLAAYNVGLGHVYDARKLTREHGDDPNKWADVKKYLPLLAKKKYYKKTKHGYARGWEPVKYVQHIRHFYNILSWNTMLEQRRLAQLEEDVQLKPVRYIPGGSASAEVSGI